VAGRRDSRVRDHDDHHRVCIISGQGLLNDASWSPCWSCPQGVLNKPACKINRRKANTQGAFFSIGYMEPRSRVLFMTQTEIERRSNVRVMINELSFDPVGLNEKDRAFIRRVKWMNRRMLPWEMEKVERLHNSRNKSAGEKEVGRSL